MCLSFLAELGSGTCAKSTFIVGVGSRLVTFVRHLDPFDGEDQFQCYRRGTSQGLSNRLTSTHVCCCILYGDTAGNSQATCSKWEDIDHDVSDSVAGALTGNVQDTDVMDPLGLGGDIE